MSVASDLLLLQGKLAPGTVQVTLAAGTASTVLPGRDDGFGSTFYQGFIRIKPGRNKVVLSAAGNRNTCLDITYAPNPHFGRIQLIVFLPKDQAQNGPLIKAPAGMPVDLASMKKRLALATLMQQSVIADLVGDLKAVQLAPYIVRDAQGEPDIQVVTLNAPRAALDSNGNKALIDSATRIMAEKGDGRTRFFAFYPGLKGVFGVGGSTLYPLDEMYSLPVNAEEIISAYTDFRTLREIGAPGHQGDTDPALTAGKHAAAQFGYWLKLCGRFSFGVPDLESEKGEAYGGASQNLVWFFIGRDKGSLASFPYLNAASRAKLQDPMWFPDPNPLRLPASPAPAGNVPGLAYVFIPGKYERLPNFGLNPPSATGTSADFTPLNRPGEEDFAMAFEGFLQATAAGPASFRLISNDGSRLFIDDKVVVENDGLASAAGVKMAVGATALEAGYHRIRVEFFKQKDAGAPALSVQWTHSSAPTFQPVPVSALSRESGASAIRSARTFAAPVLERSPGVATLSLDHGRAVDLELVSPSGRFLREVFRGSLPAGVHRFPMPAGSESGLLVLKPGR